MHGINSRPCHWEKVKAAQVAPTAPHGELPLRADIPDLQTKGNPYPKRAQKNGYGLDQTILYGPGAPKCPLKKINHSLQGRPALYSQHDSTKPQGKAHSPQ